MAEFATCHKVHEFQAAHFTSARGRCMSVDANPRSPTARVLMLEDNADDAALIMRKLATERLPLVTEHVRTARQFIEQLANRAYDLILCDFSLPGWNGLEALRWVRKTAHDVPFIYVSGTLGEELAIECIREGATDYVLKNNLARLPHAIRRALDERELRRVKRRIEQEKLDSEKHYRMLFESNPQPMWVFDRNTLACLAVNEAAVSHYGYTREEFRNMMFVDLIPKEDREPGLRSFSQKESHRFQVTENWRHKEKDGSLIEVEVSRNRVIFSGNDAILVLARDVTEVKKNEEKLRQSEERFSKAFRSSPMAITISTISEGRYIEANDAFLRMLDDRQRDEVIGHTSVELDVWERAGERRALVAELVRVGWIHSFETTFNSRSRGPRAVRVSAEVIHLGGFPCALAITNDITDAKAMEEQFRQAQKMEAVGRLAGGVAHDFNNMLSVIMGYCDLGLDHSELETVRKDLWQIKQAAHRAAKLTGQLLAFSRQQVLRPSVLNLNRVVDNLLQMLLRVVAADVKLTFEPCEPLGSVKADLGQTEQILMNLVVNARDALPRGGAIVIETAEVQLDAHCAKNRPPVRPGKYVKLTVSDTGEGMDSRTMSKIFEPFFTTKSAGKGTGLGLSMVYGAMEQAGGHIAVYSEPGKGTTFNLYFPRVDGEVDLPFIAHNNVATTKGSETVLLVEDEGDLRQIAQELLEREGYKVLAAADGEEAIGLSTNYPGSIDLLLTDVVLPGMGGCDVAHQISETRGGTRVLYMSGYTGALITSQGTLEPGAALLSKPFNKSELLRQVRAVLDQ